MSDASNKPPDKEDNDKENTEDSKFHNNRSKKSQDENIANPDKDLDPIEPYQGVENVTKPLRDIFEPSTSKKIRKCDTEVKKEESEIKIKDEKQDTKAENRECGIKIKDEETRNNETGGSITGVEVKPRENEIWVQITPEMLMASMKRLHYLKHSLSLDEILGYISRRYSVNADKDNLKKELTQKLQCACEVGFFTEENGSYRLTSDRDRFILNIKIHFKQFWEKYENLRIMDERKSEKPEKKPRRSERLKAKENTRKRYTASDFSTPSRKRKRTKRKPKNSSS